MRAAVVDGFGETPRCQEFQEPPRGDGGIPVRVLAAALENFDRVTVGGHHYASRQLFPGFPAIVGHSGVGEREDGSLVAFGGLQPPFGTMAEMAVIPAQSAGYASPVPGGVDPAIAAALPASAMTSLLPLRYGARLQPGESVLVNGSTGVSGRLAVQIAGLLGAGRVVGTGRSRQGLAAVAALGASGTVDLGGSDESVSESLLAQAEDGFDVVLDLLWGRPTELLLQSLVPAEAGFPRHRTRLVQLGASAGDRISLRADALRTSGLELTGVGRIEPDQLAEALGQIWEWLGSGRLGMAVERVLLAEVASAWDRRTDGSRIVIVP